ncbi:MAG: Ppx/GppA phosphatase family protein [Bryobacteraceae bacterium]
MPRYAAIDIGSNSLRMLAADAGAGGAITTLAEDRQVTRLGESVFRTGAISEEAIRFVCAALTRMADAYKKLDVVGIRAVATSAVRDASNQTEFVERATEAIGAPVEIISGLEEARLIHLGVQVRWPHPAERILLIDIGGGSAEFISGEGGLLRHGFSRPLGAVRLTEVFLKHDPPTPTEIHQLEEFIEEKLAPVREKIGMGPFDAVIGTSSSAAAVVCAVNRIPRARRDEADHMKATLPQLRKLYADLLSRDLAGRRKITGIGPRRAEIVIPGAAVLVRTLEDFKLPRVHYSRAGVRDGIIADLAARGVGREFTHLSRDQKKAVEELARHYGVDVRHARKVAGLAHTLFVSLQTLHRLPPYYGRLLEAAAYLRDSGHYVSDTSHHKHSLYLIANSDLPAFTAVERRIIAVLCRYHRKALPSAKHDVYQALTPDHRRAVLLLTPLLRIADALDRSREQRVEEIRVALRNGSIDLGLLSEKDTDLEQWAAERAAESFQQIYECALNVSRITP